jgi:hypothetical protein
MFKRDDDDQTKLNKLKKCVESSYESFRENNERFNQFMKFIFKTGLTTDDLTKLDTLQKPPLEFNVIEAIVSRMRGEFARHEPNINVSSSDGVEANEITDTSLKLINVIEKYFRAILNDASNDSLDYDVYTDALGGGFSGLAVTTEYINEMSFNQIIKVKKIADPTMMGFDMLARASHKGDGMFCFQLIPKTKQEFEEEFGKETKNIKFVRNTSLQSFNWSYTNQDVDILLVADFYYKVRRKEKLAKLSNGHTILYKHYDDFLALWNKEGFIEQAPIVENLRDTIIERIDRVIFCETEILKYEKTNYRYLPIVFVDGNSINVRDNSTNASEQVTRPVVYHAMGLQKLFNFTGQTVASEMENMVQHKLIVALESIPKDYVDAYKNIQQMSNIVYHAYYEGKAEQVNPPPREVQRTPTPPIVENVFNNASNILRNIIGNFDGILETNDKQISGVAIQQGALQSDAAGRPYLMGFIKAKNRIAEILLDLIPKYYKTPRSIPIMEADGKRSYQKINYKNDPDSISLIYDPNSLQVKVEAGVSLAVQKQIVIEQLTNMSKANEIFSDFFGRKCLELYMDNVDMRNIEVAKKLAAEYMKEMRQKEEQAAINPPQDPMVQIQKEEVQAYQQVEMGKLQAAEMKTQGDMAIQAAKVANEKQALDIKYFEVMNKLGLENRRIDMEEELEDSRASREAVEIAMKMAEQQLKRIQLNKRV